ncbi:MAG: OmpA family protein, partial [Venatoribacter sp.]
LTANSQTVFFDGTTHSLTGYALEGVVKPEHEALFGIVDAPVSGERIGLYTHHVAGAGTGNYELIIVDGALRIRPAGASVLSGTDFENGYNAAWVTSVATHKLLEQERVQSQETRAEVHNIISVPTRQSYLSLPLDPRQQAERLVSTIPEQLFTSPFNTSTLQYEAELKQRLTPLARYLSHNKHIAVVITGFTDDSGKDWYNESLSLQRADNVAQILEGLGVDQRQLYSQGQGAANPRATNDTLEGRNLNRRVEMKFIDTRTNKPI